VGTIGILVLEKGKARLTRFDLDLRGETTWALPRELPDLVRRAHADLVTIVDDTESAEQLARELRVGGVVQAVFIVPSKPAHPGEKGLAAPAAAEPPENLLTRLMEALLEAQGRPHLSPLTRLPGSRALQEEVERRLARKESFSFLYFDLDNFKAYNDVYGFAQGDEAIKLLGRQALLALEEAGGEKALCVHIGGDDFGLLLPPEQASAAAERILRGFEAEVPKLYSEEDRKRGGITTTDRRGEVTHYPLMTVSIAGVSTAARRITSYLQLSEIAAEVKAYAKAMPGNVFVQDRRRDQPPPPPQ
jgi:diguanylate cyclase (GGDEF)-like protein